MTDRRASPVFLALALLGANAPAAPKREASHEALWKQCLLHAADPKNPWALAHGITALGPTFAASDGRPAAEVIVSDFLRRVDSPGGNSFQFDRFAPDGTPIEPHLNLQTKTLVLAKVPLDRRFKASFGEVTLGELVKGVERGFRHTPASEEYWRGIGWTLDLLSATRKPGAPATFRNGAGEAVDFDRVMDDALAYLEASQAEIAEGMERGLPQVAKRRQGIYAHACGGLHLFQAVASWARHPQVRRRWGRRLDRQIDVLFYRLGSEARQYEAVYDQAPGLRLQILTQMVKFYGHFLETTGRLKEELRFRPSKAQRAQIARAQVLLDRAVRELKTMGTFESMDKLRQSAPQIRLDLIGDACHASHGWDYWRR